MCCRWAEERGREREETERRRRRGGRGDKEIDRWKKAERTRGWPREFEGRVKGFDCSREKGDTWGENETKLTWNDTKWLLVWLERMPYGWTLWREAVGHMEKRLGNKKSMASKHENYRQRGGRWEPWRAWKMHVYNLQGYTGFLGDFSLYFTHCWWFTIS